MVSGLSVEQADADFGRVFEAVNSTGHEDTYGGGDSGLDAGVKAEDGTVNEVEA